MREHVSIIVVLHLFLLDRAHADSNQRVFSIETQGNHVYRVGRVTGFVNNASISFGTAQEDVRILRTFHLGEDAAIHVVRKIRNSVLQDPNGRDLGGELVSAAIEPTENAPYSAWEMAFTSGEEHDKGQSFHSHFVSLSDGTILPGYTTHRLLFVTCALGRGAVEIIRDGKVIRYVLPANSQTLLMLEGSAVHRFVRKDEGAQLVGISIHPLDSVLGPDAMNVQTLIYDGSIPAEVVEIDSTEPGL